MRGHPDVIESLRARARDELAAAAQYVTMAARLRGDGYERLAAKFQDEAGDELRHFGALQDRLAFLGAEPVAEYTFAAPVGADVAAHIAETRAAEGAAVANYGTLVSLCFEVGDHATRLVVERILADEDAHVDWAEAQLAQMAQMGVPAYLQAQVRT